MNITTALTRTAMLIRFSGKAGRFALHGLLLISVALSSAFAASSTADPLRRVGFESMASEGLRIVTQFSKPDSVPGVVGQAWRSDGFSSRAEIDANLALERGFTISLWVALESYPSDLEVPANQLSPSSILRQSTDDTGFDVWIDTYGRWGVRAIDTQGRVFTERASGPFPLHEWALIALRYSPAQGSLDLFQNGELAAQIKLESPLSLADAPITLAWPGKTVEVLVFEFNGLNGAFDELTIEGPLTQSEMRNRFAQLSAAAAPAAASLSVPESRFAQDHLRPRYHGMPPANWTNEPHGLVRKNGTWHLFYQRTPNGPYKTMMHWGHMSSEDLVRWSHHRDALYPELQDEDFGFDQKGIWSGDVIVEGDTGIAFYTSVNHSARLAAANPGIAMAVSTDPLLENWEKRGPIIDTRHVRDFRDPYLWREGNTWHMIIGAAVKTGGGLDYYRFDHDRPEKGWQHQRRFSDISYRILDIGSDIWEMPVFERLTDDVHILVVNPIGGNVSKYGEPGTRGVYWTGRWDGKVFTPDYREPKELDVIVGHLSPTVARGNDGALRAIGIVDERRTPAAQEAAGWAHTFSAPRRWFLMPDRQTLGQSPAPELNTLRREELIQVQKLSDHGDKAPMVEFTPDTNQYELLIESTDYDIACLSVDIGRAADGSESTNLTIDRQNGVTLDRQNSNLRKDDEGPLVVTGSFDSNAHGRLNSLRLYFDGSVADVFINDSAAFSFRTYPSDPNSRGVRVGSCDKGITGRATLWPLAAS